MTEGTVRSNGITMWYQTFGNRSDPTLVLIAGAGAPALAWPREFCERLTTGGRCVVCFDNRDVGLSQWFDASASPYNLSDMAADTLGLLDALEIERAHLVGRSMGGMIAQIVAIEHPHRVLSLTSVMSTTGEDFDVYEAVSSEVRDLIAEGRGDSRAEHITRELDMRRALSGSAFPFDENWWRAAIEDWVDVAWNPLAAQRHVRAIHSSPARGKALSGLKIPTLVIHGTEDLAIPYRYGEATAAAIPDAELLTVEGMGHEIVPGTFNVIVPAIVRFTNLTA